MKKFILLLLILQSCAVDPSYAAGKRKPAPTPTPSSVPSPIHPTECGVSQPCISIGDIEGATPQEIPMIYDGMMLANSIMSTYCYKQWVLAAQYTENNGLTQDQIWNLMVSHPVKVDVEMYTGSWWANHKWKTVGFENEPYDGVVHMNRYFVQSASMVADNLVHEAEGHSQGFHHYGVFSTSDPYGQNYAFEGCTHPQEMQAKGGKHWRPPGIKLEIRHHKRKKLAHSK